MMVDIVEACLRYHIRPCHMSVYKRSQTMLVGSVELGEETSLVRDDLVRVISSRRVQDRLYSIKNAKHDTTLLNSRGEPMNLHMGIESSVRQKEPLTMWDFRYFTPPSAI